MLQKRVNPGFVLMLMLVFLGAHCQGAEPPKPGDKLAAFSLPDVLTGQPVSLSDGTNPKATVIIFIATQCPYSNAFNGVMARLGTELKGQGVRLIGINPNKTEPTPEVADHARKNGLTFPVLKDEGSVIANRLGATVTPEVYLVDSDFVLRYHGAVGNSRKPTTRAEEANAEELRQAVAAVLAGEDVPQPTTKMFGCTIKR